jgi:hypothetical protein
VQFELAAVCGLVAELRRGNLSAASCVIAQCH